MKKINLSFFLLLIISIIFVSCSDDKKSTTEPEKDLVVDPAIVGTWDLTKITTSSTGTLLVLTPEQAGLSFTVTFNSDGSFESTTIDSDGTVVDTGVWGAANGILTIDLDDESPDESPYTIEGNIVTLDSTIPVQGLEIPATLEFTKRT